ncbi:WD40 repeat-like protein [Cristinia sonorae]|uniref:WD40 repeat-like protein n=1 Tax=Cristinia sonorae TaxID=1940300 RepID=A0A8K0UY00_9AGAR|nr:WD40 repeat-like protein [Cristinia sonorae]
MSYGTYDAFASLAYLAERKGASLSLPSSQWKRRLQSTALHRPLDRTQVLGKPGGESGHTGCVNALSWALDGEVLLSGGDDTTVRLWRMDVSNEDGDCSNSWASTTVINTGHRGNIFNAQMLPGSSRIVTVARDKQVRISDVGDLRRAGDFGLEMQYTTSQANVRVLRCHDRAVKRITTEHSPDLFLTVSEDGTVRQHDLRVPHDCRTQNCPAPLVQLDHPLSTLALSPLTPYQFVVAGESQYGYLFDRRHTGRRIMAEWGVPLESDSVTTCVRRLGRAAKGSGETRGYEHVTGARMASNNGHEVLLSYSSDAVYLYSTLDSPRDPSPPSSPAVIPPNTKSSKSPETDSTSSAMSSSAFRRAILDQVDAMMEEDIEEFMTGPADLADDDMSDGQHGDSSGDESNEEGDNDTEDMDEYEPFSTIPVILPQRQFKGHCNVETVKDVNVLGPSDEFVVSGSDDGNWFIWDKKTGKLHDILEGDGHVVNVIEGHPYLPLVAVSGIDTTVKLFGPKEGPRKFSRMADATSVIARNTEVSSQRIDLASLATYARIARLMSSANPDEQPCTTQ